jgi:hypothetical protein
MSPLPSIAASARRAIATAWSKVLHSDLQDLRRLLTLAVGVERLGRTTAPQSLKPTTAAALATQGIHAIINRARRASADSDRPAADSAAAMRPESL